MTAGNSIPNLIIGNIEQSSTAAATAFHFTVNEHLHACSSGRYLSSSSNDSVTQCSFSLLLAAFSSGKAVTVEESAVCVGDAAGVGEGESVVKVFLDVAGEYNR